MLQMVAYAWYRFRLGKDRGGVVTTGGMRT
jgi:hypothetical protein